MSDNQREFNPNAITALKEELDVVNHEDPDKHWIGASLPVATDAELQPVGAETTAGSSPLPARADHVHGIKAPWTVAYTLGGQSFPFGAYTDLAPWVNSPALGSEDWSSTPDDKFIHFPRPGLYLIHVNAKFTRVGGGNFPANTSCNHGIAFIGTGGTTTYIHKYSIVQGVDQFFINEAHMHFAGDGLGTTRYFLAHNDPAGWVNQTGQLVATYLSSVEV